jgi:hypothetical protein
VLVGSVFVTNLVAHQKLSNLVKENKKRSYKLPFLLPNFFIFA